MKKIHLYDLIITIAFSLILVISRTFTVLTNYDFSNGFVINSNFLSIIVPIILVITIIYLSYRYFTNKAILPMISEEKNHIVTGVILAICGALFIYAYFGDLIYLLSFSTPTEMLISAKLIFGIISAFILMLQGFKLIYKQNSISAYCLIVIPIWALIRLFLFFYQNRTALGSSQTLIEIVFLIASLIFLYGYAMSFGKVDNKNKEKYLYFLSLLTIISGTLVFVPVNIALLADKTNSFAFFDMDNISNIVVTIIAITYVTTAFKNTCIDKK